MLAVPILATTIAVVSSYQLGYKRGSAVPPPPQTNWVAVQLTNTTPGFLNLTRIVATNGAPEYVVSAAPALAPSNSTVAVEQTITRGMFEAFAAGVKLGASAAWRGASKADIDAIQSFVHSNRLDLVTGWFEEHAPR